MGHAGAVGADGESKLDVTLLLYHLQQQNLVAVTLHLGQFERETRLSLTTLLPG